MLKTNSIFKAAASRWMSPALLAVVSLAATPAHAVVVTELADAGQTLASAQVTSGASGALTDIFGAISSTTDADLFRINITSPTTFSASTVNAGTGLELDTQLFLFTLSGAAVYLNDDDASGLTLRSTLPAGSAFGPVAAGQYYLGIALSGYNPVNINNQLLFAMSSTTTDTVGPASGLQPAVLGGFFDSAGVQPVGAYDIRLTGAAVAAVTAVPEPASALMFLLGGGALGVARLARRKALAAVVAPAFA